MRSLTVIQDEEAADSKNNKIEEEVAKNKNKEINLEICNKNNNIQPSHRFQKILN